VIAER
jgi:hypothetical protein